MGPPTSPDLYKFPSAAPPFRRGNGLRVRIAGGRLKKQANVPKPAASTLQTYNFSHRSVKFKSELASEAAGTNSVLLFFFQRSEGQGGCHGFLRHNAANLMQWQCTVQGKLNEIPSLQLLSSWAQIPFAVFLRASRYRCYWTGGS